MNPMHNLNRKNIELNDSNHIEYYPSDFPSSILNKICPFFFIVDQNLAINECGSSLKKIAPQIINNSFENVFSLSNSSFTRITFTILLKHLHVPFVCETISGMKLKGQLIRLENNSILFTGSPLITDIDDFERQDISHFDFSLNDLTHEFSKINKQKKSIHENRDLNLELNALKSKLSESEQHLSLQYEISNSLAESNDIIKGIANTISSICKITDWKCGAFWIPDHTESFLKRLTYWKNEGAQGSGFENFVNLIPSIEFGKGLPGNVWKNQTYIWINDTEPDSDFVIASDLKVNLHSALGFPVKINNKFIGVFEFYSDKILESDPKLIQLFEATGKQIAQFIERKNAQNFIGESENRYKQMVENANDIIYRTDRDGYFTYVNPVAAALLKMQTDEFIGKHFSQLIREDYRFKAGLHYKRQFLNQTRFSYLEFPAINSKGEDVWLGQNVSLIYEDGITVGFQSVARDITERKKFENEILHAKEEAENSRKTKEQFLANMSHEIRTPMNAIIGISEFIATSNLTNQQSECIEAIKTSAENLLIIINDILDFSKIEAGKITIHSADFDLKELTKGVIDTLRINARKKDLTLQLNIANNTPNYIKGDKGKLRQILLNLICNSIKFTNKGGITVNVRPNNTPRVDDKYDIVFDIIDTGIGIPENKLTSIFDNFTQISSSSHRIYGGTGLGLTIAKELVEIQGGSISVQSELKTGSVFTFNIPFELGNLSSNQKATPNQEETYNKLENLNVLIVEDNIMNQLLAKKVLSKWKCCFDTAENGHEALAKLSKHNYDVILMDIQMPEMDGYETTRYIRKKLEGPKSKIPIIAMTAHAIIGESEKCMQVGMNEYISKPFNIDELYNKLILFSK